MKNLAKELGGRRDGQVVRCVPWRGKALNVKHLAARNRRLNYQWPKQNGLYISLSATSRGRVVPGSIWLFDCVIKDPGHLHPAVLPFPECLPPSPHLLPSCVVLVVAPDTSHRTSTPSKEGGVSFHVSVSSYYGEKSSQKPWKGHPSGSICQTCVTWSCPTSPWQQGRNYYN